MPGSTAPLTQAAVPASDLRLWARYAPLGLIGVGLGVSMTGEATIRKGRGEAFFGLGTLGLGVLGAGLCLFGEAVKRRALADIDARAARQSTAVM